MIPKILHFYWGGSKLPQEFDNYRNKWALLHPGWKIKDWDDGDIPELYNQGLYDRAEEISPNAPCQFRSDVLRYELLYLYGGVWVDYDLEPLKPIDNLCREAEEGWLVWEETGKWIANTVIAMEKGYPLMLEVIRALSSNIYRNGKLFFAKTAGNTVKSGPQFLTPIARRYDLCIYPQQYFFPYSYKELYKEGQEFPESYAIHKWNHKRSIVRNRGK